jgi:hypothetical protein
MLQLVRHLTAVLRELPHDLLCSQIFMAAESLVSPVPDVMQLLRQVLARGQAAVQVEDFHQVDDRPAPIELFLLSRSKSRQYGFYIDI